MDSIQLAMSDASGNPSGFTAALDATTPTDYATPGNSLGTLNGSLNPVTSGIYIYTPASSITLSPSTQYFIVLTARTPAANGAYDFNYAGGFSYEQTGDWYAGNIVGGTLSTSTDGSSWQDGPFVGVQYALNATDVPEPPAEMLLSGGGILLLGFARWKAKRRS